MGMNDSLNLKIAFRKIYIYIYFNTKRNFYFKIGMCFFNRKGKDIVLKTVNSL